MEKLNYEKDMNRYMPGVTHLVIFESLTGDYGWKGETDYAYLKDNGYRAYLAAEEEGHVRTLKHMQVVRGQLI